MRKRPAHVVNRLGVPIERLSIIVKVRGITKRRIHPPNTGNIPGGVGLAIDGDFLGRDVGIELASVIEDMLDVVQISGIQILDGRTAGTGHPSECVLTIRKLIGTATGRG